MIAEAAVPSPSQAGLPPMPRDSLLVVATALVASLLVNLSGQSVSASIGDIQGAIGASADQGAWLSTAYTMGLMAGIVAATVLVAAFGPRRCIAAGSLLFALAALASAAGPAPDLMIALRALQGLAAGAFGPIAFVAVFTRMGGPRLAFGLSLLALILLLPASFAPAFAGLVEDRLGWEALFLAQAAIGGALASTAILLLPGAPVMWAAMRRDWTALALLALASAATMLVLGQGTRLYWLESPLIVWGLAVAAAAWAGVAVSLARSPLPVLDLGLLARRAFMAPIGLNFLFRTGFATTAFLFPQYLVMVQGYRPLELAPLFLWIGLPQLLAYPLAWWLLQRIDGRLVAGLGLLLFGLGALLLADNSSLAAAGEFRLPLALIGAGQILLLVPALIAGGSALTPADGPTATLMFNGTTVGGTNVGVAIATELVTERQKFHAGALAEAAAAYGPMADRIEPLSAALAARSPDEAMAAASAVAFVAAALRREAWVLSFNDAFLLAAALLAAAGGALLLFHRQPPLRGRPANGGAP